MKERIPMSKFMDDIEEAGRGFVGLEFEKCATPAAIMKLERKLKQERELRRRLRILKQCGYVGPKPN